MHSVHLITFLCFAVNSDLHSYANLLYSILDLEPEKSLSSQIQSSGGEDTDIGFPLKEDPKYGELDCSGASF